MLILIVLYHVNVKPIMYCGNKATLRYHCRTNYLLDTKSLYDLYLPVTPTPLSISSTLCALTTQSHEGQAQCRTEILFSARTLRCPYNQHNISNLNPGIKIPCLLYLIGVRGKRTQAIINMEPMRALSTRETAGAVNTTMGTVIQMFRC
jgi:hypothetical protein